MSAGITGFHGVRYLVTDVERAVAFYTQRLGFTLKLQRLPAFAVVNLATLEILLSGPGASGSPVLCASPAGELETGRPLACHSG